MLRVLMFGWEFPPFISGGLGTACYGLTKGLSNKGVDITFVLPKALQNGTSSHVDIVIANKDEQVPVTMYEVNSLLRGYLTNEQYLKEWNERPKEGNTTNKGTITNQAAYGKNLYEEVYKFAEKALSISSEKDFDIIHAHDWMTYPAAMAAKHETGKPMVLHIHNTVFDRYGDDSNRHEFNIEYQGFHMADTVIAVSEWTKQRLVNYYNVNPDKIKVVHNAVDFDGYTDYGVKSDDKIVLSLGRVTRQKGLMHLLWSAKKAIDYDPEIKFVIGGTGDMVPQLKEETHNLGIEENVIFSGWLSGRDIDRAYQNASLFIMPSISEPFGIMPLEAMRNKTPVIISKQSGVSEVINHCLKVDFWDIDQMANKIVSVIRYKELQDALRENGHKEIYEISWDTQAERCLDVYNMVL